MFVKRVPICLCSRILDAMAQTTKPRKTAAARASKPSPRVAKKAPATRKAAAKAPAKKVAVEAPAAAKATRRPMSPEHKEALATGRQEGAAIRRYLDYLNKEKQRPRQRSAEDVQRRISWIDEQIQAANSLGQVRLRQRRLALEEQLRNADVNDASTLEEEFIKAVAGYSERKGITWSAWRASGVPAAVLAKAGVPRRR